MSFGEHLDELRKRLFRTLVVIALGTGIAVCFQDELLYLFTVPHRAAMARVQEVAEARRAVRELARAREEVACVTAGSGAGLAAELLGAEALLERLHALRAGATAHEREWVDFFGAVLACDRGSEALGGPLARLGILVARARIRLDAAASRAGGRALDALDEGRTHLEAIASTVEGWRRQAATASGGDLPAARSDADRSSVDDAGLALERAGHHLRNLELGEYTLGAQLGALSYVEAFVSHLKVSLLAGFALALPWLIYELWSFVSTGLYRMERRAVFPFIPCSLLALAAGVVFGFEVLIPLGLAYLGAYGSPDILVPMFTIKEYVSLVIALLAALGLIFQLPLIMVFLVRADIADTAAFRRYRRYSILGSVVVAAILTPPDVVSQLLMAAPLILLYEVGIIAGDLCAKRKKRVAVAAERPS